MAENQAILELTTSRQRRRIIIDGSSFELRDTDELNLGETVQIQALSQALEKMSKITELAPEAADETGKKLKGAVALIMPSLGISGDALTDTQRLHIINAFCAARKPAPAALNPQPEAIS